MKKLYALTALSALLATTPAAASDTVSNQAQSTYSPGVNNRYDGDDVTERADVKGTIIEESDEKDWDIDD